MTSAPYDQLEIGDGYVSKGRTITEADLVAFCSWSGDSHPMHTDVVWSHEGPFGERVAPGALTLSVSTGLEYSLMESSLDGAVIALYGFDHVRFPNAVRVGDTVHLEGEVVGLEPRDEASGVVRVRQRLINQRGETVLAMDRLTLRRR